MSSGDKKNILGVLISPVTPGTAAQMIIDAARDRRSFPVSALAVHGVMTGVMDHTQLYRLNRFALLVADGQPVRWALNFLHHAGLKQRVYGPNLMLDLLALAEKGGLPVYFYGSTKEVLDRLCANVGKKFPGIQIAGAEPSAFGRIPLETAGQVADKIRKSGARIIFVGLGCPRQEVWAYEFNERVGVPIVAVGAAFPFIAGTQPQAPRWMQDLGLEWLFRLAAEPRRLWRRYLVLGPAYLALVFCQWLGFKFQSDGQPPQEELLYG